MSCEQVFFTLYDRSAMRNNSLAEAEARCMDQVPHRFIRVEIEDEGDGLEIKSAQFITRADIEQEAKNARAVLETMMADMDGEIEG